MTIYSHYDNLKVTRNAPSEVIRAAYRTLSQKYHPDRNPGNASAARAMALINISYAVLSDPVKRRQHDAWLEVEESAADSPPKPATQKPHAMAQNQAEKKLSTSISRETLMVRIFYGLIATFIAVALLAEKSGKPSTASQPKLTIDIPNLPKAKPTYVRPRKAPNGQPWPVVASYLRGYPVLNAEGLSLVTVDNGQNDSDVYVKLVAAFSANPQGSPFDMDVPVRWFYIPAFGQITLGDVSAGYYDVRYRDLKSGGLSKSAPFELIEVSTVEGTQYSNITMTLYKVRNGNMQTHAIGEAEFKD